MKKVNIGPPSMFFVEKPRVLHYCCPLLFYAKIKPFMSEIMCEVWGINQEKLLETVQYTQYLNGTKFQSLTA